MEGKLKKELGLLNVFCIASGAMISSGLFILPALAYTKTGPAMFFSYIIAGLLILPAMFAQAELATAMPRAGGTYFFIERSMGAAAGTIGGLTSWFSLSFKSAFALVGMGIFTMLFSPGITEIQVKLIAVGCCLFFMFVNIIGVKHSGRLQIALVLSLIGILILYVLRGSFSIEHTRYIPFMPLGIGSVFATAGLVFISFGGLTKICSVAEEVDNPGRNIPLGMFLAFAVVMVLYALVALITVGLLEASELSGALTPLSLGAGTLMGPVGSAVLGFAAFLAFVSTANAGLLTASRDPLAMSRDQLLPGFLKKLSVKFKTPYFSIVLTSLFMIIVILFLDLEHLVKTASTLMILLFAFVNLSVIVMRESKIETYRPKFRSPFYPWIQIFGIVGYAFLIFEMGRLPVEISGIFIACALAWYLVYARAKVRRRSGLMHIIERVTAQELKGDTLRDELREIIIERDRIIEDRFDRLVRNCEILDIDRSLSMQGIFRKLSATLSKSIEVDKTILFDLFMEREKETSTVIAPGLAVPHIVVRGVHKFDILLVRCREGITFPEVAQPVHTMFVLVGSADERNFHLRALAAIAQIAQDKAFDEHWLKARNSDQLRDLILLAERRRVGGA
jgi:amino acid transporter